MNQKFLVITFLALICVAFAIPVADPAANPNPQFYGNPYGGYGGNPYGGYGGFNDYGKYFN